MFNLFTSKKNCRTQNSIDCFLQLLPVLFSLFTIAEIPVTFKFRYNWFQQLLLVDKTPDIYELAVFKISTTLSSVILRHFRRNVGTQGRKWKNPIYVWFVSSFIKPKKESTSYIYSRINSIKHGRVFVIVNFILQFQFQSKSKFKEYLSRMLINVLHSCLFLMKFLKRSKFAQRY